MKNYNTHPCLKIMNHFSLMGRIMCSCYAFLLLLSIASCDRAEPSFPPVSDIDEPYINWELVQNVDIKPFGSLNFAHQSAAAYNDYAFFVLDGRSEICMYNLKNRKELCSLKLDKQDTQVFHCNQSTFGSDRFSPSDPFPLLYVSQRAKKDGRCFIEVFRIIPQWNNALQEYQSFDVELVQTVFFPKMTYENCMGNVNCVIDTQKGLLYTYSRNNNTVEDNYGQCKVSAFNIPSIETTVHYFDDDDILHSFMIGHEAINMQGGCIKDGILYIGQGFPSAGYVNLVLVDLERQTLIRVFDLLENDVSWEPEGCFSYGKSVMLATSNCIYRVAQINGDGNNN